MQPPTAKLTNLQRLHAQLGAEGTPTSSPTMRREDEDEDNESNVTEEKMTKVGNNWGEELFFFGCCCLFCLVVVFFLGVLGVVMFQASFNGTHFFGGGIKQAANVW